MCQQLKVLIVEDSEEDFLILLRILQKGNYELYYEQVITAEEMNNALDKKDWDVILSDYSMPQFNGLDALRLVQAKKLDVPFIIVSGVIGEENAVDLMKAGVHDYIVKGSYARLLPAIERELRDAKVRKERNIIEEELIKDEIKLLQAEKLSIMGKLAASIAHESRNHITAIKTIMYSMENSFKTDTISFNENFLSDINVVTNSIDKVEKVVQNFLSFTKTFDYTPTVIEINSVIDECLQFMTPTISKYNITLYKTLLDIPVKIFADKEQIKTAIINLIINSIQALPANGQLSISTKFLRKINNLKHKNQIIRIQIKDNGHGISTQSEKHIFEPFFTTKDTGTGIGLYVVNKIVKNHNGIIKLKQQQNNGTTFNIYFPVTEDV